MLVFPSTDTSSITRKQCDWKYLYIHMLFSPPKPFILALSPPEAAPRKSSYSQRPFSGKAELPSLTQLDTTLFTPSDVTAPSPREDFTKRSNPSALFFEKVLRQGFIAQATASLLLITLKQRLEAGSGSREAHAWLKLPRATAFALAASEK
ncbi:hypothetical protein FQN49_004592 [Arthroderma sp. PD_2]|nr:hypothetical protein FQN49_004592 [Arthroderma sp. PD_2]